MPLTTSPPSLHYESHGTGEPLLSIIGFGVTSALTRTVVAASPPGVRWITYDQPGTGRSAPDRFACTTGALAGAALRVLDELGLEATHVAGTSLGGAVALELALRAPHRVRSLILMATTAGGPLGRETSLTRLAGVSAQVAWGSLSRRRLWFGPALYSNEYLARRAGAQSVGTPYTGRAGVWALVGQTWAATLHDRSRDLHRIAAPTLVVHGDRDVLLPVGNAQRLAAGIPGAQLHVVSGGGHAFALERPSEVASLIARWVKDHASSPP
jgi:pimeloyl-ACP methyl ester carboxylesterase